MQQNLETGLLTAGFTFTLTALYFLLKNRWKRKIWAACQHLFEVLFTDINGMEVSHKDRADLESDLYGLVYGEIVFESFSGMLSVVKPQPGEVFYDLGSGTGKAVFCAALLYDWKKCCGIELLSGLHQLSIEQHKKFQNLLKAFKFPLNKPYPIEFIQSDLLVPDISDADVIFINATCFKEEFWQKVMEKLKTIKSGSRIILASKRLDESQYQLMAAEMLPMSWGLNSVHIYKKYNNSIVP